MYGREKQSSPVRSFFKYIAGIALVGTVSMTLLSYSLYSVSSPKHMKDRISGAMQKMSSKAKLLKKGKLKEVFKKQNLDPKMLEKLLKTAGKMKAVEIKKYQTMVNTITGNYSKKLRFNMRLFGGASILLLIFLFMLSRRFGKLVSPGVVSIAVALPGMLVFGFFKSIGIPVLGMIPYANLNTIMVVLDKLPEPVLKFFSKMIFSTYLYVLYAGLALLVLAFIGKFIYNIVTGKSESDSYI